MQGRRKAMQGALTASQVLFLRAAGLAVTYGSKAALVDGLLRLVDSKDRVFPISAEQFAAVREQWDRGARIEYQVVPIH